jgi:hypothetical protein
MVFSRLPKIIEISLVLQYVVLMCESKLHCRNVLLVLLCNP